MTTNKTRTKTYPNGVTKTVRYSADGLRKFATWKSREGKVQRLTLYWSEALGAFVSITGR